VDKAIDAIKSLDYLNCIIIALGGNISSLIMEKNEEIPLNEKKAQHN
jgi:hypothetical protein